MWADCLELLRYNLFFDMFPEDSDTVFDKDSDIPRDKQLGRLCDILERRKEGTKGGRYRKGEAVS